MGPGQPLYVEARPPKALDRVTVSAPLPFDPRSGLSLSFINLQNNNTIPRVLLRRR